MRLKELIIENNIKPSQFMKDMGYAKSTYYTYINGKCEPNISELKKIADYFNITIDYLVERENEEGNIIIKNNNEQYSTEDLYILHKIKKLSINKKDAILRLLDTMNETNTTNQYNNNGTHNGNVNF